MIHTNTTKYFIFFFSLIIIYKFVFELFVGKRKYKNTAHGEIYPPYSPPSNYAPGPCQTLNQLFLIILTHSERFVCWTRYTV